MYTSQAAFPSGVTAPGYDSFDDLRVLPYLDTLYRNAGGYAYQAYPGGGLWGAGGVGGGYWLSNNYQHNPVVFVSDTPLSSVILGTDGGAYWPTANNVVLAVHEPAAEPGRPGGRHCPTALL